VSDARYAEGLRLRALDAFVLDSIGLLDPASSADLESRRADLAAELGAEGATWHDVIRAATGMPAGAEAELRTLWSFTQVQAEAEGRQPDALAFTRDLVDATFGVAP
jgi:hypothetical protein